jgi:hypothetical protein
MTGCKKLTSLAMMAGVAVLATSAQAFMVDDAKILIDRALNSPTLTIKYSGAAATLVELKINGTSFGTRTVNGKSSGETNFNLDLTLLADGDNEVEVFLYGKDGALVGKQKTNITSSSGDKGPVYLVNPKVGSTVKGTVDIKVGFGKELRDAYVSFFVNSQFRSMTNNPPFSYLWDTTREASGWHEIEAVVVNGQGETFKTPKTRVFVDNGGGRTTRHVVKPEPVRDPNLPVGPKITPEPKATPVDPTAIAGVLISNAVTSVTGARADLKPTTASSEGVMMDQRNIAPKVADIKVPEVKAPEVKTPPQTANTAGTASANKTVANTTNNSVIQVKNTGAGTAAGNVNTAASSGMITIAKGQRLPNMSGALTILMNAQPVTFDVAPRIENGIPLTPFRHLFESAGGSVDWDNLSKELKADGDGNNVWLKIGNKTARINKIDVDMEIAPFLERGRTIVPLSFIRESLSVDVQYDPKTGHVLITKAKKN